MSAVPIRFAHFAGIVASNQRNSRPGASAVSPSPRPAGRAIATTGADARGHGAGTSKVARPGKSSDAPSRFAHLAGLVPGTEFPAEAAATPPPPAPSPSAPAGPMTRGQIIQAIAANQGMVPGAKSPEDVAQYMLRAAGKATAPAKAAAAVEPSMDTPEGVAAYILACAAKARGGRGR